MAEAMYMEDLYTGMINLDHFYYVSVLNGDKIVLEYSEPWSLKTKVTSKGAKV